MARKPPTAARGRAWDEFEQCFPWLLLAAVIVIAWAAGLIA